MAIETSFKITQVSVEEALKEAESKVQKSAKKMNDSLSETGKKSGIFGSVLGGILSADAIKGTAGKIKDYISGIIDKAGGLGEASSNIGISGEQLQVLQYAARQAGLEVEALPGAFAKLKDAAGGALAGDEGAANKFKRIGISVQELKGKKPWEIFELVAEAINDIKDPTEKTNAGIDIFGKSFDKMGEFLKSYKSSIEDVQGKGIISEEQLNAADAMCDKIADLQTQLAALAINSGFLEEMNEILQGLDAMLNKANLLKKAGIVTREQAVSEVISKAETSGKYTADEIRAMKDAQKPYSEGTKIGFFGAGQGYKKGYGLLDNALKDVNPKYSYLGRDEEGNFGYGEMTMPISKEDIEREKQRKEEERKRREERKRVQEEYQRNQVKQASGNVVDTEAEKREKLDESDKKMVSAAESEKMKTTGEQIAAKEKQVYEEAEKQARIQSEINALKSKTYSKEDYKQQGKDIAEIAKKETEIRESKSEQLKLQLDIEKLKEKSKAYYKDSSDKLDSEIEVQKQILQGKNEEAERQKIINELKAKGLSIDDEEVNKIMQKKKELAGLRFSDQMQQQGYDLLYKQQSKVNYRKAEYDKRVMDKERELGISLNDEQKAKIKQQLDLEIQINNEPKLDFSGLDIKTNSLTARGGFQTGAVVVDKDRVNQQIRDYGARQVNLLNQIKSVLEKGGVI